MQGPCGPQAGGGAPELELVLATEGQAPGPSSRLGLGLWEPPAHLEV